MTIKFSTDAEATRAIKATLRAAFPNARISVTRGGEHIEWEDVGPTVEQVEEALLAAGCATAEEGYNGKHYRIADGRNLIWFERFNTGERAAFKADMERRAQEREAREQRENEAVLAAEKARDAAMPKRPARELATPPTDSTAHAAFESLRQRAEEDVAASDDTTERRVRPSWAPPLILEGELLKACIELGYLKPDDPPIARLWGNFASPKTKYRALREHVSRHTLPGIACRGFHLHAGSERGPTSNVLLEAQRTDKGEWQFGPSIYQSDYYSPRTKEFADLVRERERAQSGFYPHNPQTEVRLGHIAERLVMIEAEDAAGARAHYRRQALRVRVIELAGLRALAFSGNPGVEMVKAGRLWGHCCICGRTLTDPISLERGVGPECIVTVSSSIKFYAAKGAPAEWIAARTGMPIEFVTVAIDAPR